MTNLEWLIKENPELVIKSLSEGSTGIKVNKDTGVTGKCDDICDNCLFTETGGCVYRITKWLQEKHKEKKLIKDLTQEETNKICDSYYNCNNCLLMLGNGYCYKNIVKLLTDEYGITVSGLAEFEKKLVEV